MLYEVITQLAPHERKVRAGQNDRVDLLPARHIEEWRLSFCKPVDGDVLAARMGFGQPDKLDTAMHDDVQVTGEFVITSYSIHYTKLYDDFGTKPEYRGRPFTAFSELWKIYIVTRNQARGQWTVV